VAEISVKFAANTLLTTQRCYDYTTCAYNSEYFTGEKRNKD